MYNLLRLNMRQLIILAHNSIIVVLIVLFIRQGLAWKTKIAIRKPNLNSNEFFFTFNCNN